MTVRFGAINVLNPQSPDYVTVGDRIKEKATGREIVLARSGRAIGGRWGLEGAVPQPEGQARGWRSLLTKQPQRQLFLRPLDNADGTLKGFDKII